MLMLGVLVAAGFFAAYKYSPDFRRAADETLSAAHMGPTTSTLTNTTSTVFKKADSSL